MPFRKVNDGKNGELLGQIDPLPYQAALAQFAKATHR